MTSEMPKIIKLSELGNGSINGTIAADETQREALANRFDLPRITSLNATYSLQHDKEKISFTGAIDSHLEQLCAVGGEAFPVQITEDFDIVFTPKLESAASEEEIELAAEDCDIMEYEGAQIDIGEAIAQTLYLALDPFPRGPNADAIAEKAGFKSEEEAGPFGALAALKDKLS